MYIRPTRSQNPNAERVAYAKGKKKGGRRGSDESDAASESELEAGGSSSKQSAKRRKESDRSDVRNLSFRLVLLLFLPTIHRLRSLQTNWLQPSWHYSTAKLPVSMSLRTERFSAGMYGNFGDAVGGQRGFEDARANGAVGHYWGDGNKVDIPSPSYEPLAPTSLASAAASVLLPSIRDLKIASAAVEEHSQQPYTIVEINSTVSDASEHFVVDDGEKEDHALFEKASELPSIRVPLVEEMRKVELASGTALETERVLAEREEASGLGTQVLEDAKEGTCRGRRRSS
ncbi:hypothetical protein HDV00_002714 [Rhizophlyctis rosea]|nr:hypothetical protein HDV00_002714 [Rhizophlyctis rosea]